MTRSAALVLLSLCCCAGARAAEAPPVFKPHYASQRGAEAYLREGPSYAHKVLWVYRHRGYPFQVIASFDVWRRVRDPQGAIGWMSAQMLSDGRTLLVTGNGRAQLHESADPASKVVGLADSGAILGLKSCTRDMCRGAAEGIDGWIAKNRVWGVDPDEVVK